jgi:hypothetical protein
MRGAWTDADCALADEVRLALHRPERDWGALCDRLGRQRLRPLAPYLGARDGLPGVRRLIVLPSPALAGLPLETFAADYAVSYAPSATWFAYLRGLPPVSGRGMLALADPVFEAPGRRVAPPPLPPGGVLVGMVLPGSAAERARLRADDVLLRYAGIELESTADLLRLIAQHGTAKEVRVTVWRAGRTDERTVPGGKLGVALADQGATAVLAERNQADQLLARGRAAAAGDWSALPGTRVEAEGLQRLCRQVNAPFRLLADSDASEQELDRLARANELARYRYLHLATHGDLNDRLPLQSAVILSRDGLPDPLKQLEAGGPVYDGRLTAGRFSRAMAWRNAFSASRDRRPLRSTSARLKCVCASRTVCLASSGAPVVRCRRQVIARRKASSAWR